MSKRLTNKEISDLYKKNKDNKSLKWKKKLFNDLYFLVNKKNFFGKKDLAQEASLGLWTAIITFDFNKNFDFFRWSKWHISYRIRCHKNYKRQEFCLKDSIKLGELYTGKPGGIRGSNSMIEIYLDFEKWIKTKNTKTEKRDGKIIADWLFVGKTLTQVAEKNDLSIERVRQIKENELKKFVKFFNS